MPTAVGVDLTLQLISLLMLLTAAYLAVLAKTAAAWVAALQEDAGQPHVAAAEGGEQEPTAAAGGATGWLEMAGAAVPVVLALLQWPHMLVDYVMASSIEVRQCSFVSTAFSLCASLSVRLSSRSNIHGLSLVKRTYIRSLPALHCSP
eukprot:SAG22_NODE_1432_length_4436_cov_4.264007_6_plen_148_part_00